jgi:hypothetical protein
MSCVISYDGDSVEIENAEELFVALEILPPAIDKFLLEQFGDEIGKLITNDEEFLLILERIIDARGASKLPFLSCIGDRLNQIISQGETVRNALALLANEADQEYFLQKIGQTALRNCMASVVEIAECLEWLYGKMDHLFLEMLGWEFITKFVSSGRSLGLLVKSLDNTEQARLLDYMGWDKIIQECIQDSDDLMYAFVGLGGSNDRILIDKLVESKKLPQVIPSLEELNRICLRGLSKVDAEYLQAQYTLATK